METRYIDRWINNMDEEIRESSRIAYKGDIVKLYEYMLELNPNFTDEKKMLSNINNDIIEDYKKSMIDKYCRTTINRKLVSLKTFFNYIVINKRAEQILIYNPMEGIKQVRNAKAKSKDILSLEELNKILDLTRVKLAGERGNAFNGARDRFLLRLLTTTGLRVEEALSIKFSQLDIKEDYIMINFEEGVIKNHLAKRVPITKNTMLAYVEYLEERNKLKKIKDDSYLIVSMRGNKMGDSDVNANLEKMLVKANIQGKKITAHSFRKLFKTQMQARGVNMDVINLVGGWQGDKIARTYTEDNCIEMDLLKLTACEII